MQEWNALARGTRCMCAVVSSFVLLQRLSSKITAKTQASSLLSYGTVSRTLEPKPRQPRIIQAILFVCAEACGFNVTKVRTNTEQIEAFYVS